jgi:glycyl-tRNA synthetase
MTSLDTIIALAKRRGFVFPGSDIYGGLAGTWDYGPLGVALKNNIKNLWWQKFVADREDMYGVDAALLMNGRVWEASGHVAGFSDPLVECKKCKRRFRADHVEGKVCPECKGELSAPRAFNMMFKTLVGAVEDSAAVSYLRPETAQGIFVNFKNIVDAFHPKLPFGIAQIGKAFRNEITPRDFIFRVRELEQMEVEYFVRADDWERAFEEWRKIMLDWCVSIGLDMKSVSELEIADEDRAHYSKRTIDFEFEYPFGKKELYGLAYRTDYDLGRHIEYSSKDLTYFDEETKERLTPHVIEPSLGVERTMLALLLSAYREDEVGGEKREYLAFKPSVAPIKAAIFPLVKNKPDLVAKAREVYVGLKKEFGAVTFDDNGNIGKRYRRQDEIGTPWCITVDYQTLEDGTVTVRDRDTAEQERVAIGEVSKKIREKLA